MEDVKQDLSTVCSSKLLSETSKADDFPIIFRREHTQHIKPDNQNQIVQPANMVLNQKRKLKVDAADKAEEERQAKWAIRVDVVYHFFAYRYFDRTANCLDLLNFTDADIDSFNLTANKTRGLDNWHVCAEYLKKIDDATPETNTHRRRLIYKVRSFNKTQPSHFRFFLQNLTDDDVAYVQDLCEEDKMTLKGETTRETRLMWATSLVDDEVPIGFEEFNDFGDADPVDVAIEKCLEERRQKLRKMANGFDAANVQEHVENADTVRDHLTKQFEKFATDANNEKSANATEYATPGSTKRLE